MTFLFLPSRALGEVYTQVAYRLSYTLCTVKTPLILRTRADTSRIIKNIEISKDLQDLVADLINYLVRRDDVTCLTVVSDPVYLNVFEGALFKGIYTVPNIMIVVEEREDLLSPNFNTLESLRQARNDGCNVYLIILANGLQVTRLLKFGYKYRLLDTRAKYIMLHDVRLFHSANHYLWKSIVNVIFLKYHSKVIGDVKSKAWFDLSTVPFPNIIKEIFIPRRVDIWRRNKFHYGRDLFADKTGNLYDEVLNVVYVDHVPSVVVTKSNATNKVGGVEIEILKTLAQKMHFKPKLYEPINVESQKWGHKQDNGSFSGLLGEMVNSGADVALGNLQYTPSHLEMTDLSIPYTSQCWTFLTPEALTDNSWKTLILPFKLNMWIAVLLVLLVTGSIFYGLAIYYMNLLNYKGVSEGFEANDRKMSYTKPVGLYLFGEISNSILYTYGMLVVVSLPKLPTGWSIRLLTGWYWLYCILLVVSYRASMTAILANPTPRVTIDTLQELVDSKIACGGWGSETKKFFLESLDEMGQKIGEMFENVDDPEQATNKIAQGIFAYYDSENFLKYLTVKRKNMVLMTSPENNTRDRNLHIMKDCVVNIPISIGFHKNSPLKPLADVYLRRIVEVGLVEKWLNDAMYKIRTREKNEEEVKALINLKKLYCAFVALSIGYTLSSICLFLEFMHWHFVVKRDPGFDKYAMNEYYMHKNKKK
ncbi:glutamate receptor ionotropic, kainate glr-3 [Danaus plexippus]|uniref:glutamate receptor ionotropic, kainate glr-3 n=1 Tax=Danaus plexippus TaxID=13037 RepID=UPI002AAFAAF0|nr:glutamate receptor ionotropic, kainate glr-3 [Danaus plexippus]